jgi:hypothetical protein
MIFLHEFFESGILSESEINNKKNELFGSLNHWFRLNYEPQNSNYTFYNTILFHKTHAELPKFFENAYSKNLYEAKDFFKKKLDAANSFEERRAIKKIVKNLFERFLFSTYLLDERLDVHRVFETMNNRGRQLSKLELLKNRIIYLTSSLNIIYEKKLEIRNRINNVWKQIYAYLAKNPKSILRDDAFLKVHGIMYFDHTEASDSEMKEFTESTIETYFSLDLVRNKTENPKFITKYLDSLEKSIKNWYFIKNPSAENSPYSKDIIKWLTKLNRLSPNTFFEPLILAIAEKEFDNNEFVTILKKIEIHEFLVFKLSGARSNKNRVKFYHLASEFYNRSELSIDDICNRIGAKTKEYYNANKFQTHMNTLFKDNKKRNWRDWVGLEYFLWEYEEYLCNLSNNEMLAQWGKQSIDFILPENFSKNGTWGVSFSSVGADKQRRYCYALGNLLLVSKKRTDPESKKIESFEDKKTPQRVGLREIGYSIGSYSEREVARHPDWTPQSIFERSLKLLDFMADRFEIQIDSIRKSLTNVNYEANYVKIEEEEHDF